MTFSQRIGLEPTTKPFQTNSMDRNLRTSLWNTYILHGHHERDLYESDVFVRVLWIEFLNRPWPLDIFSLAQSSYLSRIQKSFLDESEMPWNKVYDFLEFVADLRDRVLPHPSKRSRLPAPSHSFVTACNEVLEKECSAYRFVGKTLAPITNEAEIAGIRKAASTGSGLLKPVAMHIDTALKLLSDKTAPDYRNSMKESISAVEALCKIIAKDDKATLGPALAAVTAKVKLHPKLQEGFKALYGYTSDTHGIRHALKDEGTPDQEDATFMLVSCSAFVNYLTEKARKNGLLPK